MSRIFKKLNIEDESAPERSVPELKLVPDIEADPRFVASSKIQKPKFSFRPFMIFGLIFSLIIGGYFSYQKFVSNNVVKATEVITEKPKFTEDEIMHQEALGLIKAKDYAKALEKFEILTKKYPNNSIIINNVGLIYLKLNDYLKAEMMFREVLKIDIKDGTSYNNLGSLKLAQMKADEAISFFYQAILYLPGKYEPHLNLAKAFELAGRPMEAIPEYQYYLDHTLVGGDPVIRELVGKRMVKLNSFSRYIEKSN